MNIKKLCGTLLVALPLCAAAADETYSLKNRFGLELTVRPNAGEYVVLYDGQEWLGPGIVSVFAEKQWYRSSALGLFQDQRGPASERKLSLRGVNTGSASDAFGAYDFIDLSWEAPGTGRALVTGFRLYRDNPYLVFVQKFPAGFKQYAGGNWRVPSVAFPQFIPDLFRARNDLSVWTSNGMYSHKLASGNAGVLSGTVDLLLLADEARNALVLSPFANYLVATQQSSTPTLPGELFRSLVSCGIEGLVPDLPAGFEHSTILVAGAGVHDTFVNWGGALLKRAGKPIPSKYADDVMKYMAYVDDYGAYYREHGFKEEGYAAYEDIVLGVEKDAREHDARIGSYFVLDADQIRYQEGIFEPQPAYFPHGIERLHERLGKPLQCYILWLAPGGPYRKQFPFFETDKVPGPWKTNPPTMGDVFYSLDYWRYTAKKIASWGAISLQHDFLSNYEGDPVMMASLDGMNTYFHNMAQALQEQKMTMHYCMQAPRHILQSTENPVMVSLQGTQDHHVGDKNEPVLWKHLLFTNAFYGAVGIWPSRDNMQSRADPNAFEDVLLADLTGGSIQLGHRIGEADWGLLKKLYRAGDGLVLKPDRPIVPLDRCYLDGSAVGFTESAHNGQKWYYVLSLPSAGYRDEFSVSDVGAAGTWAVYDWDRKTVSLEEGKSPIHLLRGTKHQYFVLAPLLENGMAVIGDPEKFVTMADQRIASVAASKTSVRIGVIADGKDSPVLLGYSARKPSAMESESGKLTECGSQGELQAARSGWYWDAQTKLWSAKLDFSGVSRPETRSLTVE